MSDGLPVKRLTELDGIRGVAALLVTFGHYTPANPADPKHPYLFAFLHDYSLPNISVMIFFGLSAFLLAWQAESRFDSKLFVLNRFLRIYPLYLFVVLITVFGVSFIPHPEEELQKTLYWFPSYVFLGFNWHLALGQHGYLNELNHVWSLCVEMQFYLLFALLFARSRELPIWIFAVLALAIGVVSRIAFVSLVPSAASYYSAFSYIEVFAFCAAAGVAYARGVRLRARYSFITLVWLVVMGWAWTFILWESTVRSTLIYPLLGVTISILLLQLVSGTGVLSAVIGSRPLRWLGSVSYGLYMWHLPIKSFLYPLDRRFVDGPLGTVVMFAFYLATCLLISWITYRTIEVPCNAYRSRFTSRRPRQSLLR
jgi:peptidoglycan/LPS O-acetylase OafA/YrhL